MDTRQGAHYVLKVALSQSPDASGIFVCDLVCVGEHKPSLRQAKEFQSDLKNQ